VLHLLLKCASVEQANLLEGRTQTQRSLYYNEKSETFPTQAVVTRSASIYRSILAVQHPLIHN
jgi:DNA topoisomerase VI subunit A